MVTNEQVTLTGSVAVSGTETHNHGHRRLAEAFPVIDWIPTEMSAPDLPTVTLAEDHKLPEGGFSIEVLEKSGPPAVTIRGGPFSGVIYGVEELIQRLAAPTAGGFTLPAGTQSDTPSQPYRTFWNWDHSTNWDLSQIGAQEIGVMNPYARPSDGFLSDFKRCVDFMSQNRIAALTIYGFLRESHGGIEAAQELCRYATERGVRILPGVAINAYGGIVWEMDHEFNLATWLRKYPELAAEMERPPGFQLQDLDFDLYFPNAEYAVRGCPSRPENQQWMEEGIAWLAETFDIGGINIEAGDYGVCGCDLCNARRAEREDAKRREEYTESWSHADMADFYPRLYNAALSQRSDLWIYSEIQWDNLLDPEAMEPLRDLPEGGIYQHTFNRSYWERARTEMEDGFADKLPTRTNVYRCQFCCQWNGDHRTERYRFNGRDFADMAKTAARTGFDGLTVWGEPSPYTTSTELSYLAFSRFTWDPELEWDTWIDEDVAPRLGGRGEADRYLEFMTKLDENADLDVGTLLGIRSEALDMARSQEDEIARRWLWLADQAARREFMASS